jgi:hypothetical protein
MRHSLPWSLAAIVLVSSPVTAAPRSAAVSGQQRSIEEHVTVNDLVKLAGAGLNDDVLVALIESHDTIFSLTAGDILALRERGLSQKVILAMLQTAAKAKAARAAEQLAIPAGPDTSRIDPAPADVAPPAPPVVVNVTQQVEQHVESPRSPDYSRVVTVPVAVPIHVRPPHPVKEPEPVYWGFGGQRRPGTWQEPRPAVIPKDKKDK